MKGIQCMVLCSALLVMSAAVAQTTERVRGTITAFKGDVLSVKSRDGKDLRIELTEKATVTTVKAIKLSDLKAGDYVGATTRKRADGVLIALEIHTLPQGVGEGHREWDLEPDTMMTNANISSMVQSAGGQDLVLEYKGGSQKILVPVNVPIVTAVPADRAALKPGEYVFLNANVGADGKLTMPGRMWVSKDGVKPPQ
jgi:hypothetical protein